MKILTDENLFLSNTYGYKYQLTNYRRLSSETHKHTFYELIYVISGEVIHTVNNIEFPMKKNQAVILCPGDSHFFINQTEDTNILAISFSVTEADKYSQIYENCFHTEKPVIFFEVNESEARDLYSVYKNIKSNVDEKAVELIKILLGKFSHIKILKNREEISIPVNLYDSLKKICTAEYICGDVNDLVRISGYSKTHLTRLVKKYFNKTVHEYIKEARLNLAYDLIVTYDMSFEEISERVGYNSYSYFYKIFTEYFNITPSKLRKMRLKLL